jgi:hypothetical protein
MKTKNTRTSNKHRQKQSPIFKMNDTQQEKIGDFSPSQDPLSFFDIKELYDRAYAAVNEGRDDYKAKEMMAEAIKMDMTYRCQLERHSKYNKQSKINDFRVMSDAI